MSVGDGILLGGFITAAVIFLSQAVVALADREGRRVAVNVFATICFSVAALAMLLR